MSKLKHVKLFENFGTTKPAQLLVSGDWTGITKDGSPLEWIAPATFIFKYLPEGSPIPSGYENYGAYNNIEDIAEEAFGGDQNGVNVAPKNYAYIEGDNSQYATDLKEGVVRLFIDPLTFEGTSPEAMESYLRAEADSMWATSSDAEYYQVDEWPAYEKANLNPVYLRLAEENKPFPRKVIFKK
jgi:hypothetical protein